MLKQNTKKIFSQQNSLIVLVIPCWDCFGISTLY